MSFARTVKRIHKRITRNRCGGSTGGCWGQLLINTCDRCWALTCCQRMVHAGLVAAHDVLDGFICCEVYGMCRPCADNHARHASPQTQDPFAGSHFVCPLYHAVVDGGGRRIQDLHSSLRRIVG